MVQGADGGRGVTFIPLMVPDITDEDIEAATAVLRSGMLVQGKEVAAFELEVANYLDVPHAVAVSSGTSALHLALVALGIGPGDEVIVPAFSFVATANVVELVGARCVFVDVQRDTFNLDPDLFEQAITPRTKAVIPVHEFGLACDISRIAEIADAHRIAVIEDAACALGAKEAGRFAGTIGRLGAYSLHPRKAVTSGEGGVVVTRDGDLAARIRSLRNHGIELQDGRKEFVLAGFNYRMTDFQAALVRGQFRKLDASIARRESLAQLYFERLSDTDAIALPTVPENKNHTWQTFHAVLENGIDRDAVIAGLRDRGTGSGHGAQCIPAQAYYREKYRHDAKRKFPNAYRAYTGGIALPLYGTMSSEQVTHVVDALISTIKAGE